MQRKWIITGIIVIVAAIAAYFLFFRSSAKKYEFRFDSVSKGDLTVFVTSTGAINPVTSVDVGTQVSGIVSKLYADFNSVVRKGQVIAQIDSTFLIQSVKDAQAGVQKARAQLADSKRALDRQKALLDKHLDSQVNYDAALTNYESNDAVLKSAIATLDRAKINLAYATIYAPISGVVINRAVMVGQTVAASFSSPVLYTIANDLSKMQVLTTVDESDIGRISIGQNASFTVEAYDNETFHGTVSQIRLASVSIQNVVNYTVVIDVNNDQLKLMPGMTATVKILVANLHDVLKVPNMALRFQPPVDITDTNKVNALKAAMAKKPAATANDNPPAPGLGGQQPAPSKKQPRHEHTRTTASTRSAVRYRIAFP
jgi:HlyD family secretion protein